MLRAVKVSKYGDVEEAFDADKLEEMMKMDVTAYHAGFIQAPSFNVSIGYGPKDGYRTRIPDHYEFVVSLL